MEDIFRIGLGTGHPVCQSVEPVVVLPVQSFEWFHIFRKSIIGRYNIEKFMANDFDGSCFRIAAWLLNGIYTDL